MKIIKKGLITLLIILLSGCESTSTSLKYDNVNPTVIKTVESLKSDEKLIDFSQHKVIAHAMGGIDQHHLTNSLQAFLKNYEKGTRIFEIDLEVSSDNRIVLTHGWPWFNDELVGNGLGYTALDYDTFTNSLIYDQYQPLTIEDVIFLLQKFKDIYLVIDSKTFDLQSYQTMYQRLIDIVKNVDESLLERIVPQAYDFEMVHWLKEESTFQNYILTCYAMYDKSDGKTIYDFVRDNQVPIVVMHMDNDWAIKVITDIYAYATYDQYQDNFKIYIHTVNDMNKALDIVNKYHFNGIYSDFIGEDEFGKALLNS